MDQEYLKAHSTGSLLFVASLFEAPPQLVDISREVPAKQQLPSAPIRHAPVGALEKERQVALDAKQSTSVTIFTPDGRYIITGTNKGWINIIGTESRQVIYSMHLCSSIIILLRLTSDGSCMVSNSSDRIIRTIPLPEFSQSNAGLEQMHLDVEHKFQDVVNRLAWNHVAFSSSGDYVTASTYENHDVYIWERSQGSLVKILEGPREELGVVEVRESSNLILSTANYSSGIHISRLLPPAVWKPERSTFGQSLLDSAGLRLRPTLLKLERTSNMLSAKMNLIFILLKKYTRDDLIWKMRLSTS